MTFVLMNTSSFEKPVKKKNESVCNLKGILILTGGRWNRRERTREDSEERQEGTAQGQIKLSFVYVSMYVIGYLLNQVVIFYHVIEIPLCAVLTVFIMIKNVWLLLWETSA